MRRSRARRNEPLVYLRELDENDVPRLVEIEELAHAPDVRDGIDFFETMLGPEWHEWPILHARARPGLRPIRLGLAVGTELVGYMIARGAEADGEPLVHIDDLAVLPDHRRYVVKLLGGFFRQHSLWYAGTPVIAHAYDAVARLFERHRRVGERGGGLTLVDIERVSDWVGNDPLYRVRWEPCAWHSSRDSREPLGEALGSGGADRGRRGSGGAERGRRGLRESERQERGAPDSSGARADAASESAGTVRAERVEPIPLSPDGGEGQGEGAFEVAVARTVAQWESLAAEWDALLERVSGSTAFQTYRYQRLWWDHFGAAGSLSILTLRRAGQLVGIAPLAVFPAIIRGRAVRQLGFIGSRWEIDRPQLLLAGDSGEREACARAFARALVAQRDQWDVLHLYEQPPASTVITALARSLRAAGYLAGQLPDSICPFIRTEGNWDTFLDSRSRSLRKNLQRGRRRLERDGPVEYRIVDHAPAVCQAFDQYLDIEGRSWKANTDAGLRADAVSQSFCRDLTALLGPDRLIEFRFIDVAGQPVAGTFGIRHDRRFYSLKIAHDQRFAAASPGTLLESLEIRDCFDRDVVEYDFLGGFLTNKNRWTDDTRETVQVFAFPRRGHWIPFYVDRFVVRPRVKQLLRRAGWLDPLLAWRERVVRRIRKQEPH